VARLEVRFAVDADGLLHVTARELTTGIEQQVEVKPSYGLSDEEIERMLLDAYDHAEADVSVRALREERVEAQRIRAAIAGALEQDAALLEPGERERIEAGIAALDQAVRGDDHRAIHLRVEALDDLSREFAGRRMDASIRRALTGQRVTDVERDTAHAKGIESHLRTAEQASPPGSERK
jgi:molecular chaperone HscA